MFNTHQLNFSLTPAALFRSQNPATGGIITPISKDFEFGKVLGTGGFAVVKVAKHIRTDKSYAVKVMNIAQDQGPEEGMTIDEIAEEIRLTMSLAHPQVVKIHDFYQTKSHVYVVMELLNGGELLDAVMELGHYTEKDAAVIMKQLFTGLISVHSKNITHRDLKLENLILAEKGDLSSLRIADFGLAKKMKTSRGKLSAQCGSPAYVAPEVITGQQYTPAVDMWATGCIMYALLCGELPFFEEDEQAMFRRIAKANMHKPNEEISADGMDLLNKLLTVDKVKRLTAVEALEHKWITGAMSRGDLSPSKGINRSRMARFAESSKIGDELTVRELKAGELLIKQGARAKEVFLIKEGVCEVIVNKEDGSEVKVAERKAGEFIGEMGVKMKPDGDYDVKPVVEKPKAKPPPSADEKPKVTTDNLVNVATLLRVKNTWVGGRRGADVRAVTDMKVLVMTNKQMQWILEHDYGVDGEMTNTIKERKAEMERNKA